MDRAEHPRPRVLVSRCLGFAPCRWNGVQINDEFVSLLDGWVDWVTVCPEMDIGLGAPRDPVRLVEQTGQISLIQPATGRDWTLAMNIFLENFLTSLPPIDGFVLKSRSPSCGPRDVKIYNGPQPGAGSRRDRGLFGGAVQERFPWAAVEHEGRVRNFQLREHFLTKLFTLTSFRQVAGKKRLGALVKFHSENKLLLMAYNQSRLREMGRLVANHERKKLDQVIKAYQAQLHQALSRMASRRANINVLMHALGYFSKDLKAQEKAYFLDTLERYRQGQVLLASLQVLLRSWIIRFNQAYLASQSFFAPYPEQLVDLTDSGKRDLT